MRTAAPISVAAGHVDGHAGDEVRVARREEADHARLVAGLGHAPQWRALDLLRLLLRRSLLPARADPFGQGHARRDRVDVDAVGPELVRELSGERDDAAL